MSHKTRIGAVLLTAFLVLAVATPAVLAESSLTVGVTQTNTTYTVSVADNGTAVSGANVSVTAEDANATYAGANGVTDANGTVTFDLPTNQTTVSIDATYNGSNGTLGGYVLPAANASDTGNSSDLSWAGDGAFGQWVHHLVEMFLGDGHHGFGHELSTLVVQNNPGAQHRSEHAHPGEHRQDGNVTSQDGAHGHNGSHDNGSHSFQHQDDHHDNETATATEVADSTETPSGNESD